jgi:hypothetical protein
LQSRICSARIPIDRRSAAEVKFAGRGGKSNPKLSSREAKSRCSSRDPGRQIMWMLLLVPFVGLLWVPFYNFQEPALFGFPFFYWYQLAWVPITSLLIWLVYRSRTPDETP